MLAFAVIRRLFRGASQLPYIGERTSMVSHMVQAAQLGRTRRYDDDVVLACLLHDVGHMIAADDTGATVSRTTIASARASCEDSSSERTCRAVELHVDAKRYLVGGGRTALSDASASRWGSRVGP